MLRSRGREPTVDTRVGGQRVTRSSMRSISSSSTISEWVDVADTSKYKSRYTCQFCNRKFSVANALARHTKYNCLQNPEAQCNGTSFDHPYVCKDCGRRFKAKKSLTYHGRHECQKFVFCSICKQKLVGATVSLKHIRKCKGKSLQTETNEPTDVVPPGNDEDRYSELILSTSDDNSD